MKGAVTVERLSSTVFVPSLFDAATTTFTEAAQTVTAKPFAANAICLVIPASVGSVPLEGTRLDTSINLAAGFIDGV